jgi:hypothetical protein
VWQAERLGRDDRRPARYGVARLAAVLLTVGLASCGAVPSTGPLPRTPTQAVARGTPAVTPGPQAPFVPVVVTATGVDRNGAAINPTSHFAVGMPIYVVCRVQGVRPGESHCLTIRWYVQGQQARVPGAYTYATVTHDGPSASA